MKTRLHQALTLFAALTILWFTPGCSTTSTGGSRTLKQTEMDVSWSMTRFRNGVAAGVVTRAERDEVNSAYAGFETAYKEALSAANKDANTPAPDNVKSLATKVIGAIQAIPF